MWRFLTHSLVCASERSRGLVGGTGDGLLGHILQLSVSVESIELDMAFTRALSVARQHKLTEYFAAYVELALRNGFPWLL